MLSKATGLARRALCVWTILSSVSHAAEWDGRRLNTVVAQAVHPVLQRFGVPGMAVGIVANGRTAVFNFGVESKESDKAVNDRTLFELGSVSKTFTATLASYAEVTGHLSLDDTASSDFPVLKGSAFDDVSLLNLGTHTSGGLPLQFPDEVSTDDAMIRYFRAWKPAYAPGTTRTYANPSIGLLGLIAADCMHAPFDELMERSVFQPLDLTAPTSR